MPTTSLPARSPRSLAILGFGCRFPGGAVDGESFWRLLESGRDAVGEIPPDRWNIDAFHDPHPGAVGRTVSRWGGFLDSIDQFEPECFGISPREAAHIDPQQRLLLETAYEACEMAGLPLESLAGSRTGVFVGISTNDYGQLQRTPSSLRALGPFTAHGSTLSIAANRISYCFDLRGPSFIVDTACSSSLVALDRAVKSLRDGESDLALVGGVNAIIGPEAFVSFSAASMLSPDGRCKAFDASANGFVRAEGAGVIVLKRLDEALRDADPIQAVILESGTNQDGRTRGLSMPNVDSQEALLREVYRRAGIDPADVGYLEAHGTGTAIGDPTEAEAIGRVFSAARDKRGPLIIGSVKSNVGHLEAGSGMASLVKVVLMLQKRRIAPNLHFRKPNPHIDFEGLRLRVPTRVEPWPGDQRGIAGINSFGFGGANAHVVLAEHAAAATERGASVDAIPLVLTARGGAALKELAASWTGYLDDAERSGTTLAEIAFSAARRRTHHRHRLGFAATSFDEARERLRAFVSQESRSGLRAGVCPHKPPQVAFVFCGQGPQWHAMGRDLFRKESVFRDALRECDSLLQRAAGWSLIDELDLGETGSRIGLTSVAQPALFAIQVALARQWDAWGVQPTVVLGHSVGEIAAAHWAGYLSLEAAVRVIAHRGRCLQEHAQPGRMIAAALTEERARELAGVGRDQVSLAAINGPQMVTLSGESQAIARLGNELTRQNVWWAALHVEHAFHSRFVEPARDPFLAAIGEVESLPPHREMVSTVTAEAVHGLVLSAEYWWDNIRKPVRFQQAINRLVERGIDAVVEIGPHPVLTASIRQCWGAEGTPAIVFPSLVRGENEHRTMLASLAGLFTAGVHVDWQRVLPAAGRYVVLPPHPWHRTRHWHEMPEFRQSRLAENFHPLLGMEASGVDRVWRSVLDREVLPWVSDHRARGQIIFPAAGFVEMLAAAARRELGAEGCIIDELHMQRGLLLSTEATPELQTDLDRTTRRITVSSRSGGEGGAWIEHCHATFRAVAACDCARRLDLAAWQAAEAAAIDHAAHYDAFQNVGLDYGPMFRGVRNALARPGVALGRAELPDTVTVWDKYGIHPALLDACFQVLMAAVPADRRARDRMYIPERIRCVRFHRPIGRTAWSEVSLSSVSELQATADLRIFNDEGGLAVEILGFRCQAVPPAWDRRKVASAFHEVQLFHRPVPETGWMAEPLDIATTVPDLVAEADAHAAVLWQDQPIQSIEEHQAVCDRLAYVHIAGAMDRLRGNTPPDGEVDAQTLIDTGRLVERHRMLFERCRTALSRSDVRRGGATATDIWRESMERHPRDYPFTRLVELCGRKLADFWQGRSDALEFLFSEEAADLLAKTYRELPWSQYANRFIAETVSRIAAQLRVQRPIRVLELGAGTGGTTSHVLPVLPWRRSEYWFTDVSPYFVSRAEKTFRAFECVRYAVLDLERDLAAQGIPCGSFDVVIAADVLHATTDICAAVRRCAELLTPGGVLLLRELCTQYVCFDVVFGLTEGWWNYRQDAFRPHGPLLKSAEWKALLSDQGFESCSTPGSCEGFDFGTLMAARKPARPTLVVRASQEQPPAGVAGSFQSLPDPCAAAWIVFSDESKAIGGVVRRLRESGRPCAVVLPGTEFAAVDANTFRINPGCRDDLRQLRAVCESQCGPAETGWHVVHAWSGLCLGCDATLDLAAAEALACHGIVHLLQEFADSSPPRMSRLDVVTWGAQCLDDDPDPARMMQGAVAGLCRVAATEFPALRVRHIDLEPASGQRGEDAPDAALWSELSTADEQEATVWRGRHRFVPRLEPIDPARAEVAGHSQASRLSRRTPFEIVVRRPGEMGSLELREMDVPTLGPSDVDVDVHFAALNFRDVLKVLGTFPVDEPWQAALGDECSGIVKAVGSEVTAFRPGDRVVACAVGSFRSRAAIPTTHLIRVPGHLTLAEAVTMPVAYVTADYALRQVARLAAGESILIHSATGGLGLAALNIARRTGARILATAGTRAKRELLTMLGADVVMDSRSLAFFDEVLEATDGRGVDVVLNSLAGQAMIRSLACLAPFGRFLEVGKRDFFQNTQIGLWPFRKNVSYHGIDLSVILSGQPHRALGRLEELFHVDPELRLPPLPLQVVPAAQVVDAMRLMGQGGHIGKIVLDMRPARNSIHSIPRPTQFRRDATYLVTGAFGGVGLALSRWLADRGAGNLVMIGRSGPKTPAARECLAGLANRGVPVEVCAGDIADESWLTELLNRVRRNMPPLAGVFHLAMVLDDATLLNQTPDRFHAAVRPKVAGAWNLHCLTTNDPLELFVMFGSASSSIGNYGQANYAAANAALEVLAAQRKARGLPATTISWGALGEIGYVAERAELGESLARLGLTPLTASEVFEALDVALHSERPVSVVIHADWNKTTKKLTGPDRGEWLLSRLAGDDDHPPLDVAAGGFRQALADAEPADRPELVREFGRSRIAQVLGTSPSALESDRPLSEMGLDSLMGVELANLIETDLGVSVPLSALSRDMTANGLTSMLVRLVLGDEAGAADAPSVAKANADSTTPAPATPRLVPLAGGPEDTTLYCLHPAGGSVGVYRDLASELMDSCRVVGVESRLLSGADAEFATLGEMATAYAALLVADQPDQRVPIRMFGFSLGGLVAIETARVLVDHGHRVSFVGLAECDPAWGLDEAERHSSVTALLLDLFGGVHRELSIFSPQFSEALLRDAPELSRRLVAGGGPSVLMDWLSVDARLREDVSPAIVDDYIRRMIAHVMLLMAERSAPPPLPIHLWTASEGLVNSRCQQSVRILPGRHFDVLVAGNARLIADDLRKVIRAARRANPA